MTKRGHPKAGIYFAHFDCLGHTSRVMAVAEVFKKRSPGGDLFFVQAGSAQPMSRINEYAKVYVLPGKSRGRRDFRAADRGAGAAGDEGGTVMEAIITRERPDLFMTEFFPLGHEESRHTLMPSLIRASRQGSALWAIAGYPLLTGNGHDWRDKILRLYQRVIIFSPPLEKELMAASFVRAEDRKRFLDFFERQGPKIQFAGYLLPHGKVVRDEKDGKSVRSRIPRGTCRVSILRGAGAVYPKLIAQAIRASELLGKEYYLTVVAGPSTTPQEWDLFKALAGKNKTGNLALLRSTGDYEGLIKESDICVSTASYHTSAMLLKHGKKAVIVPFEGYGPLSIREQPVRAGMLKDMLGAAVLPFGGLTAKALTAAVQKTARARTISARVPEAWFGGADVLDRTLAGPFPS